MALSPLENTHSLTPNSERNDEIRTCWICFGTDEDNPTLAWVQPCGCRGSGKWVHQSCLLLWVDEKKKENPKSVTCPQCKVEYIIIFPKTDPVMAFIQSIDHLVHKVCPVIAAGATVGIIFWAASSYGAFTIIQVFGEEEGLFMLENIEPLLLLVSLPMIPTTLILMKLVRWEDYVLTLLRKGSKYPVLRHIFPSYAYREVMGQRVDILPESSSVPATRIFVGALVLPTMAKIFGDVFFYTEQSTLKKCFLGGLSFIAIKGLLNMYYRHQSYIQKSKRRILNHHERKSNSVRTISNMPNNLPNSSSNVNHNSNHIPSSHQNNSASLQGPSSASTSQQNPSSSQPQSSTTGQPHGSN